MSRSTISGKYLRAGQIGPRLALGHGCAEIGCQQRGDIAGLKIVLALLDDDRRGVLPRAMRLGQEAGALDRIEA